MAAAVLMILFCFAFSSNDVYASSGVRLSKKSVTMTAGEKYKLSDEEPAPKYSGDMDIIKRKKGSRIPKWCCQGKKSGNCQNPGNGSLPTEWEKENSQSYLQD